MSDIAKMPIPKLKRLARELGVNPKQSIPKLRKAVEAAQTDEKPSKASTKKRSPKKAGAKAPAKKRGTTKRSTPSRKKETDSGDDEKLDQVLSALAGVAGKLSAMEERLSSLEDSDDDSEVEDSDDSEEEEEEETEEEEEETGDDEDDIDEDDDTDEEDDDSSGDDEIPDSVREYLIEGADGEYELDIAAEDVDEMDKETLKAVLGILGEDVSKIRSVRKLQAKLRGMIAESDEEDEPEAEKPKRRGKPKKGKKLKEVPEVGTKVTYTDDEGAFPAYVVDEETFGEDAADDELAEGFDCFIAFDADPDQLLEVTLDQITLR